MPTRDAIPTWAYLLPILGIGVVQTILMSITFPLSELLTEKPILHIDAGYHWYQMAMARAFAEGGTIVGYDPYFAAGNFSGVIPRQSIKIALGLAILAPEVSISALYKLYAFFSAIFAPSLVAMACMVLRLRILETTIACVLSLLLWWTSELRWYHTQIPIMFRVKCVLFQVDQPGFSCNEFDQWIIN